jgi:hypothetical protein
MTQVDANGVGLSFMATEEKFRLIKDMYARNMIVPLVGNFSGPKTIRAIGDWVRGKGSVVTAFYVSTVEPYLKRDGSFPRFCDNVATLPMNDASVFIRPGNVGNLQMSLSMATGGNAPVIVAAPPPGTPSLGSYQTGIVVSLAKGCG